MIFIWYQNGIRREWGKQCISKTGCCLGGLRSLDRSRRDINTSQLIVLKLHGSMVREVYLFLDTTDRWLNSPTKFPSFWLLKITPKAKKSYRGDLREIPPPLLIKHFVLIIKLVDRGCIILFQHPSLYWCQQKASIQICLGDWILVRRPWDQ